jgi:hypothetical protein
MTAKQGKTFSNPPRLTPHHPHMAPHQGGRYRVLLAGGPEDRARELTKQLARRGIDITEHRPYDKPNLMGRPLPPGLDAVLVLIDMINGPSALGMAKRCEACKPPVPCIRTHRQFTQVLASLQARGFDTNERPLPAAKPPAPPPPAALAVLVPATPLAAFHGQEAAPPVRHVLVRAAHLAAAPAARVLVVAVAGHLRHIWPLALVAVAAGCRVVGVLAAAGFPAHG